MTALALLVEVYYSGVSNNKRWELLSCSTHLVGNTAEATIFQHGELSFCSSRSHKSRQGSVRFKARSQKVEKLDPLCPVGGNSGDPCQTIKTRAGKVFSSSKSSRYIQKCWHQHPKQISVLLCSRALTGPKVYFFTDRQVWNLRCTHRL